MEILNLLIIVGGIGSTISVLGILVYLLIKTIFSDIDFIVKKIFRLSFSVTFNIILYIITFLIFSHLGLKGLAFTDMSLSGIISTVLIYAGTSALTKDGNISV